MEFSTPEEASDFYNNYSRLKGFASRRVTRCGCLAEMRIKRKDGSGKWYMSRFVEEHNRELAFGKLVDYLRSHKKISEVEVAQLTSMKEIGIIIPKIYKSFAAQLGGFNLVTFTKQDMYNEVRKQRRLQGGDVNAAIRYLEAHWENMINECDVSNVDWVKDLYSKKYAWVTAYIQGRFFAGVRTTSRCVDFLRDNEDELEFCSWYGTSVLQTEFVKLEKSAWTKFTREMFARFRESLKRLDLGEIPESLVLCRWSKTAKMEIENENINHHTTDQNVTYRTRLGAFSQLCKQLGKVACMSDEDFKLYSKKVLSDAVFLEIKYGLRPANNIFTPTIDNRVKDPIHVKTKGTGRCSQAGRSAAKTKRKCSTCGKLGHRRTRCPNGDTPLAKTNEKAPIWGHKRKRSKDAVFLSFSK
ncbi:hypothetical protein Ahy_B02g058486 [Arachis hypogaea]|uniref:CCHC-type domain-containing protein n=1 Tax=Arachis hypogaea TaxID=3818 RepID=A0A445AEQ9_ARAHY|nr:hypothetical protein Ahy_B02g058486 [Arachis hypogaea]